MELRRVRLSDGEVAPLLAGLSDEYDARYGENIEMTRATEDEFDPPAGLFIVLMDGSTTAAGGGFRRHDANTCEVKRMWTSPQYRRRGLATLVLRALEEAARETGYARIILETGPRQPEAEAM
jgi:GNAT superfamily N-acetyltransferase